MTPTGRMSANWIVRLALPADAEAILAIEQACAEAPHWSQAVWRRVLGQDEAMQPARASFVVEGSGGIVGFALVSCAGGMAELESIAVREDARCQGIGGTLCREAMAWSRSRAARVIELEVRASSAGALALYGALGFTQQGTRRGYYRDPIEDAVLMSAALQS